MDRRRGLSTRPASEEERECWSHAAASLKSLSTILSNEYTTGGHVGRVNRLIAGLENSTEGYETEKLYSKRLANGIQDVHKDTIAEIQAIDDAIERVGVLIALRKAPEPQPSEKRNKRPRGSSPAGTPVPSAHPPAAPSRSVSITLPARLNSIGPASLPFSRDARSRRDTLARQSPLEAGRKVAFRPPEKAANGNSADTDENTWILAVVMKCLSLDKHRYEVQDPEPQDNGELPIYTATPKNMIPLPDPNAPLGSAAHVSSYPEFPVGATVMALYPDTSCFYRADVVSTTKEIQQRGKEIQQDGKSLATYKLKFEDDDNQEHFVSAQFVVELPVG